MKSEIALQPGLAVYERYFDPDESKEVEIKSDQVTTYPKLKEFDSISLKVTKYRIFNDQFIIKDAEILS